MSEKVEIKTDGNLDLKNKTVDQIKNISQEKRLNQETQKEKIK